MKTTAIVRWSFLLLILLSSATPPAMATIPAGTITDPLGALRLSGVNQHVRVNDDRVFDFRGRFTMELWIRGGASATADVPLLNKGQAWQLSLEKTSNLLLLQTRQGGAADTTRSGKPVPIEGWQHIAAVYDGTTKKLYLNGEEVASANYSGDLNTNAEPVHIGAAPPTPGRFFKGDLDNVRLWSVARSPAVLRADAGRALHGNEPGLVAEWRFDEVSGNTAYDFSMGNYHGTIQGFASSVRVKEGVPFNFPPPGAEAGSGQMALRFDGDPRQALVVSEEHESAFRLSDELTLEFWLKLEPTAGAYQCLLSKGDDWGVIVNNGQVRFVTTWNGQSDPLGSRSRLLNDRWYHVAAVFAGGRKALYVDGIEEATNLVHATLATSGAPVVLGIKGNVPGSSLQGAVDLVRVWTRSRTPAEIRQGLFRQMGGEAPGLLAEWRLDEPEGFVAADVSLGERHAGLSNLGAAGNRIPGLRFDPPLARQATARSGALRFGDASGGVQNPRIELTNSPALRPTEAVTIEAWVQLQAWTVPWQAIVTKGNAWGLTRNAATDQIAFRTSLGFKDSDLAGKTALVPGRWYHLAAVYDGSRKALYVDGVLDAAEEFSSPLVEGSFPVTFGANAEVAGRGYAGLLDHVRLWSVGRTDAEIKTHLDRVMRGSEPGLIGEWRLNFGDNVAPESAPDIGSNALHGRFVDMDPVSSRLTNGLALRAPLAGELALAFDADRQDHVILPVSSAFDFPGSLTIETWLYYDEYPAANQALVSKGGAAWQLELLPSGKIQFSTPGLGGAETELLTSSTLPLREWHHLAAVWDRVAGTKAIYIDGQRDGSVDGLQGQLSGNALPVLFAAMPQDDGGAGHFFNGRLDEVRLWSTARTEAQIRGALSRHLNGTEPSLAGVWRMNEGDGPRVLNGRTGFTLHGTMSAEMGNRSRVEGPALGGPAPAQYALHFDGADDYVRIRHRDDLNLAPGGTIEAWIWPEGTGPQPILWKGATSYSLILEAGRQLRFYPGDGSSFVSSGLVGTNGWQQVTVVVDASAGTITFYINGEPAGSHTTSARIANNSLDLFLGRGAGNTFFRGQMDEVRLWRTARSASQVQFFTQRGLPYRNEGLAAYWTFDQGRGDQTIDASPAQLMASLFNMDVESWSFGAEFSGDAADAAMNLTPNPGSQGLWIGQVRIDQVNEINRAINGVSEKTTPTADAATVRILFHVDASGKVRLLKDVTVLRTTNDPPRDVLITNPALINRYEGVSLRGNKFVGIRHGTVAYDFDGLSVAFQGGLGAGVGCMGTVVLPENHSSNPYRHRYHPDHRNGMAIRREIRLELNGAPGTEPIRTFDYGAERLTGTYRETVIGLHKIPLKIAGKVTLNRISTVAILNDQP